MLEYLDAADSDSDFIPESDTNDTSEEDATPPAAHPVSDSEEDDMDDENYREILSPEQPLPLPFQFQELSGSKHMPPPDSSPVRLLPSLHRLEPYPQGDRIQQMCIESD
jgi:hypothetical protein